MWINKAKSKEAKMLRPPGLQMGRPRPKKHRNVSGAKAQTLRLMSQENTRAAQNSSGHNPLEKGETAAKSDQVSNIAQPAMGVPMGRTWKDKQIKAALFYLSP